MNELMSLSTKGDAKIFYHYSGKHSLAPISSRGLKPSVLDWPEET
jgi:hypothetical protein